MFRVEKNSYLPCSITTNPLLPLGVYKLGYNSHFHCVEGKFSGSEFKLPKKMYGVDQKFIQGVLKRFNSGSKNMGILLNGYKGSGKSLTAKIICNESKLPVITMSEKLSVSYLQDFCLELTQDCILFLDEYEKMYGGSDELLALMDGALNLPVKILFILTSNEIDVNENMLNRPSRLYYIKQFDVIEDELVEEILDDLLEDQGKRKEARSMIDEFQECTIDNVITFINEVNFAETQDLEQMVSLLNITKKERAAGFKLSSKKSK